MSNLPPEDATRFPDPRGLKFYDPAYDLRSVKAKATEWHSCCGCVLAAFGVFDVNNPTANPDASRLLPALIISAAWMEFLVVQLSRVATSAAAEAIERAAFLGAPELVTETILRTSYAVTATQDCFMELSAQIERLQAIGSLDEADGLTPPGVDLADVLRGLEDFLTRNESQKGEPT
jgi:hypothetical protein